MRPRSRFAVPAAAGFYVLLTVAITWPLVLHPGSVVPNDLGDPLLNTWLMAWNARVLPLTAAWWNTPQFFPVEGTMAFSEHLLGLSVDHDARDPVERQSAARLQRGVLPVVRSRRAVGLLPDLRHLAAPRLRVRRRPRVRVCAVPDGAARARPGALRVLDAARARGAASVFSARPRRCRPAARGDRRTRWLVLFAAAWLMQALACGYYLFYLSVLVILWLLWFAAGRERARVPGARGVRVGGGGRGDGAALVRLLEVPARVRIAARAGRNHGVQRGRREPAQSPRQPPALGVARRRRPS